MNEQMLICPHCKREFPITDALSHELKEKLEVEIREKIDTDRADEVAELEKQLKAERKKRKDAEKVELTLRQEREALAEAKEQWELEKQRELDADRENIRQKAIANLKEKQHLKEQQTKDYIESLEKKIADLNAKVEQGSQQTQGEAFELVLEDLLKQKFSTDEIIPVPKGVTGADLLQKVYTNGFHCGTIIWETKNTKSWGNDWCSKLKEDQQRAKGVCQNFGVNDLSFKAAFFPQSEWQAG